MLYSSHFLSQQSCLLSLQSSSVNLQLFMLRQRKDCHDKVPFPFALIIVVIELRVSRKSSLHSSSAMSRHKNICCDRDSLYALSLACTVLRHIATSCDIVILVCLKLCCDRECCNCPFFLLLCWNYLIFQLKPAKHKVGDYSITWHKNMNETAKIMPGKWIKNR